MSAVTPDAAPVMPPATLLDAPSRGRRPRSRVVATSLTWGPPALVVAFWLSGGGPAALAQGTGPAAIALGDLTGLVSAALLLVSVLAAARVPALVNALTHDDLRRIHRDAGVWSVALLAGHLLLTVLGTAVLEDGGVVDALLGLVLDAPGMLLATAGVALITLVGVTSIPSLRRRLRYESWHLLHLYTYLGVFLAVPHMLWTGTDLLASPAATAAWWTAWGLVAGAVVVFRLLLPLARSMWHDLRVDAVVPDGARGVEVRMTGRATGRLGVLPGQYARWRFLDGPGWTRAHPLSFAAAPDGRTVVVAARVVGDGTERLLRLRRGTRVLFEGPYGPLRLDPRRRVVAFGAGAGVVPLVAMLEADPARAAGALLVTRDRTEGEAMRVGAIRRLATQAGVDWRPLYGPRSRSGAAWLPAVLDRYDDREVLRRLVGPPGDAEVIVCGPGGWSRGVVRGLRAIGVPAARIHAERFTD